MSKEEEMERLNGQVLARESSYPEQVIFPEKHDARRASPPSVNQKLDEEIEKLAKIFIRVESNERPLTLREFVKYFEKGLIIRVLRFAQGNQKKASSVLGIKPTTLHEKIKKYQIKIIKYPIQNFEEIDSKYRI